MGAINGILMGVYAVVLVSRSVSRNRMKRDLGDQSKLHQSMKILF